MGDLIELAQRFEVYAEREAEARREASMDASSRACSETREQCWRDAAVEIRAAGLAALSEKGRE